MNINARIQELRETLKTLGNSGTDPQRKYQISQQIRKLVENKVKIYSEEFPSRGELIRIACELKRAGFTDSKDIDGALRAALDAWNKVGGIVAPTNASEEAAPISFDNLLKQNFSGDGTDRIGSFRKFLREYRKLADPENEIAKMKAQTFPAMYCEHFSEAVATWKTQSKTLRAKKGAHLMHEKRLAKVRGGRKTKSARK